MKQYHLIYKHPHICTHHQSWPPKSWFYSNMKEYYNNSTIGFSSQAPTNKSRKRALILIDIWVEFPRRRTHGFSKEGAPSGGRGEPSVGEWAATSPHSQTSVKPIFEKGGRATSQECGLPPQACTTSPRGAHLSINMCSKLITNSSINCQSTWVCPLWPSPWLLCLYLSSIMSPHVPLFLPLLIFNDFIWLFWVF